MTGLSPLTIEIGEHNEAVWFGFTVHLDTIISTLVAGGMVLLLGLVVRRAMAKDTEDHVPTKLQMVWEAVVGQVNSQVEDNLGRVHPYVAPLAISIFFFVLFANWLELIPTELNSETGHVLPAPTADVNLTYALAAVTIVSVWIYGLRQRGVKGYFGHFIGMSIFPENKLVDIPVRGVFTFLNVLEELIKPVTLALRLFGNIFAGGIMLALIAALIGWTVSDIPLGGVMGFGFNILWKGFDMFIGAIQAFIFALLAVLYFAMAGAGHDHDDEQDEEHEETTGETSGDQESADESADEASDEETSPALAQ
jgi:F-type H+-transporting ATPase subunit a